MSYGIKYSTQFDSVTDAYTASKRYTLQFLFKDYTGGITSVTCGDTPIVHSYSEDAPNTAIKGSSVKITLINKNNSLPLSNFYTEEDDDIKVIFLSK